MDVLTNREWAVITLLVGALAAFAIRDSEIRVSLFRVAKSFFAKSLAPLYVGLLAVVAGATFVASRLSLWGIQQLGPVIIFTLYAGFPLLLAMKKNNTERGRARRILIRGVTGSAIVEFMLGLYSYAFVAELILVSFITIVYLLELFSGLNPERAKVKKLAGGVLAWIGILIFVDTARRLGLDAIRGDVPWSSHGRSFLVPIWLTVAVLPYTMLIATWDSYATMFRQAKRAAGGRLPRRIRLGAILGIGLRPLKIGSLRGPEFLEFGRTATGFRDAWHIARNLYQRSLLPAPLLPSQQLVEDDLSGTSSMEGWLIDASASDEDVDGGRSRELPADAADPTTYLNLTDMDAMALNDLIHAGQDGEERAPAGITRLRVRVETRYREFRASGGSESPGTLHLIQVANDALDAFQRGDLRGTALARRATHDVRRELTETWAAEARRRAS